MTPSQIRQRVLVVSEQIETLMAACETGIILCREHDHDIIADRYEAEFYRLHDQAVAEHAMVVAHFDRFELQDANIHLNNVMEALEDFREKMDEFMMLLSISSTSLKKKGTP
jgi:hypothetical protein